MAFLGARFLPLFYYNETIVNKRFATYKAERKITMKNNKILKLNYHLFDGEGGDGSGAGEGGLGAEASAFLDSLDGKPKNEPKSKPDLSKVKYGSEGKGEASQVGSDTNGQAEPKQETDLSKEFAELVGKDGKYHEIYGQQISNAIQERFKNQADYQGQIKGYEDAVAPLFSRYGLEAGDVEGLQQALAVDEDLYRAEAEEKGIDVKQLMHNKQLEAEAERGRRITAEYEEQQRVNAMFKGWESEAEEMRQAFPNFDLNQEIKSNDRFFKLLTAGVSVIEAFAATHLNDIMQGFGQEQSSKATNQVVNSIKQQASRPIESAMSHSPATEKRVDISNLSDADIDEIMRRVDQEGYVFRP